MQPWTERKQKRSALRNEHVRIGERTLRGGTTLRGLYATRDFDVGDYVAAFHGTTIPRADLVSLQETDKARFEQIMEYAIGTDEGGHVMPTDIGALGAHLANHSCQPNAAIGPWKEDGVPLARAQRPIRAGQEITIFYSWLGLRAAVDNTRHPCACDAPFCSGTIELYVEWVENDDGSGGPFLPESEVANRFFADMMNDTSEHETLLHRYITDAASLVMGDAKVDKKDPRHFAEKLRQGALAGVVTAELARKRGSSPSVRRLRQIVGRYGLAAP